MYLVLHVKCPKLTKFGFSGHILMKVFRIELHKNPSIGSRVCSCGRTHRQKDGQTDLTKVIGAFRNFCEDARRYDVDMTFSGVIVIRNFVKISQMIQKSNRRGHKHSVVILSGYSFSFKEIKWTRKPPYLVHW
jgi:hypothetical protein